jgi:hypothetical protein
LGDGAVAGGQGDQGHACGPARGAGCARYRRWRSRRPGSATTPVSTAECGRGCGPRGGDGPGAAPASFSCPATPGQAGVDPKPSDLLRRITRAVRCRVPRVGGAGKKRAPRVLACRLVTTTRRPGPGAGRASSGTLLLSCQVTRAKAVTPLGRCPRIDCSGCAGARLMHERGTR